MPAHPPQWTDFLLCSHCTKEFSVHLDCLPITLLCGHSICKGCVGSVQKDGCRYDQNSKTPNLSLLPPNSALLQIVAYQGDNSTANAWIPHDTRQHLAQLGCVYEDYAASTRLVESLAVYLRDIKNGILPQSSNLTKPMLRKLVSLVQCQLVLEDGRLRALRACRVIADRVCTEIILAHQNPATLSGNLWTAVRARGCQFLGPAMQEEALKLILLALEDGSELSRKVLVMFVVQKLQQQFPQASKTSIGHVVQLLYRASCFVVKKRDKDSSLMKLKEIFRTYPALRREHDAQVVQIAREAGLRIAPDQWSALLYGDQGYKSHMQSIIDRLQSGESLKRSIQDLEKTLDKSSDPQKLKSLIPHFEVLSEISEELAGEQDTGKNDWNFLIRCLQSVQIIIQELIVFSENGSHDSWRDEEVMAQSAKFKTSFCRDIKSKGRCPRGASCTFAHTEEELHLYRNKRKKANLGLAGSYERPQYAVMEGHNAETSNENFLDHHDKNEAPSNPTVPVMGQRETNPSARNHCYHPPPYPSNFEHPTFLHPTPMVPVNPSPGPPGCHTAPPVQYGQQLHPAFYHSNFETYRQQLPFPPQRNNAPYLPTVPAQVPKDCCGNNLSMTDLSKKSNLSQFTVTLSFQSNPNQHSNQYQSPSHTFQLANEPNVMYSVGKPPVAHPTLDNFGQAAAPNHHIIVANNQRNPAVDGIQQNMTHNTAIPEHMTGFYPIKSPYERSTFGPQPGTVMPLDPVIYQVESPMYQHVGLSPDSLAPPPVGPSPVPTSTHLYDPSINTMFPQSPLVGQNLGNPTVLVPPTSHGNLHPGQPMYISVMPVPQYQVIDRHQGPGQPRQGALSTPVSSVNKVRIPKSIDDATVQELKRRKEEILNKMIQKQRSEAPVMPSSNDKCYDVWKCGSYSPLLKIGTAATVPEHLQTEDASNVLVDVIAELDTGTKQVTMRDRHHLNPSHAYGERALDDVKMHEILLERHHDMNVETMPQASESHTALVCPSGVRPEEDDDIIPFSDRPTVSKYGPIARSVRTRLSASDDIQVSDVAANYSRSISETYGGHNEMETPVNAYSSFETLHAVSCLSLSVPRTSDSVDALHGRGHQDISTSSSILEKSMSLSQATSNTRLLHREQAAVQQNRMQSDTEDLELAVELQQIEVGIRQKKQQWQHQ